MIMNEIQEVRRSQELLSSAFEEINNELQTVKSLNRDLQYQNTTLKEIVATLKKQNKETDVKLNNLNNIEGVASNFKELHINPINAQMWL